MTTDNNEVGDEGIAAVRAKGSGMTTLDAEDREALLYGVPPSLMQYVEPAVEAIVARHVKAALAPYRKDSDD